MAGAEPLVGAVPQHSSASRHGHLWQGADGTGLHAPAGELVTDEATGHVCCHLCGRFYVLLGAHVRVHGHTPQTYRELVGLCTTRALASAELSDTIRDRQARRAAEPEVQEMLRAGRARSGRREGTTSGSVRSEPLERRRLRSNALDAGRDRQALVAAQRLADRLVALGAADLPSYLHAAYAQGASLEALARATGLGRERLRQALDEAGVRRRRPGDTTDAGRRSRAVAAERRAAERVNVEDLRGWLQARRAEGATMRELAAAVERSVPWVRWRLQAVEAPDQRRTG